MIGAGTTQEHKFVLMFFWHQNKHWKKTYDSTCNNLKCNTWVGDSVTAREPYNCDISLYALGTSHSP